MSMVITMGRETQNTVRRGSAINSPSLRTRVRLDDSKATPFSMTSFTSVDGEFVDADGLGQDEGNCEVVVNPGRTYLFDNLWFGFAYVLGLVGLVLDCCPAARVSLRWWMEASHLSEGLYDSTTMDAHH
jgi:hypothetical protein